MFLHPYLWILQYELSACLRVEFNSGCSSLCFWSNILEITCLIGWLAIVLIGSFIITVVLLTCICPSFSRVISLQSWQRITHHHQNKWNVWFAISHLVNQFWSHLVHILNRLVNLLQVSIGAHSNSLVQQLKTQFKAYVLCTSSLILLTECDINLELCKAEMVKR